MSDAYSFRPGGSLKLKGDKDKKSVSLPSLKTGHQLICRSHPITCHCTHHRKKKKVPTEEDHSALRDEIERSARAADVAERSTRERDESPVSAPGSPAAGSSRATPTTGTSAGGRKKTAAEEKYDKIQEDRVSPIFSGFCRRRLIHTKYDAAATRASEEEGVDDA